VINSVEAENDYQERHFHELENPDENNTNA